MPFSLAFCTQCNPTWQFFLASFPLLIATRFCNLGMEMDMIRRLRNPFLISQPVMRNLNKENKIQFH